MNERFTVEMMDARELKANPKNFRVHSKRQRQEIDKSLKEFGWLETVLYNARTEQLINGHARVEQAAARNEQVPVRVVNVDYKTERRILASLQRTGDLGVNDEAMLARLLEEISSEDEELPPGWSATELEKVFAELAAVEEGQAEEEDDFDEELDEAVPDVLPSNIRTIQLLMPASTEPRFRRHVEALGAQWATETLTEVVISAVEMAYQQIFGTKEAA